METRNFLVTTYSAKGVRRDQWVTGIKSTIMRNAQVDSTRRDVDTIEVFVKINGQVQFIAAFRDGTRLNAKY